MSISPEVQQVLDQLNVAQKRILPAKMVDSPANGLALSKYIHENNLAPTAENFYAAINALLTQLAWAVKPAKLLAQEQNERPRNQNDALKDASAFEAKVKAGEVADAHAKAEAKSEKDILALISTFFPISKRGQLDHAKQSEVQKLLRNYVAKEKSRGVAMKDIQVTVSAEIRR